MHLLEVSLDLRKHREEVVLPEEFDDLLRVPKRVVKHALEQVLHLQCKLLQVDSVDRRRLIHYF